MKVWLNFKASLSEERSRMFRRCFSRSFHGWSRLALCALAVGRVPRLERQNRLRKEMVSHFRGSWRDMMVPRKGIYLREALRA